tara:strand:+ start:323 stop:799 length:477 start_codon:yes stop_codon:yes gene_type:complete
MSGVSNFEKQHGMIPADVSQSKPLLSYPGQGNPMKSGLNALQKWQEHTTKISQLGGSSSDGSTTMVVPQFDVFNPAGPDGPNGASKNNNLTLFTNKQNSWQDNWANVDGEPAVMPPAPPNLIKYKGGRKKSKKRRSKKRQTKKRRSKKRRSNKRKTRR